MATIPAFAKEQCQAPEPRGLAWVRMIAHVLAVAHAIEWRTGEDKVDLAAEKGRAMGPTNDA